MTTTTDIIRGRVAALRAAMAARGVTACLIPSADPHLSEYLPKRWQGRKWLSGFTGSVGTLIVTADFAGVWVDGRYWVQAEQELADTGIQLMKQVAVQQVAYIDWLADTLPEGSVVAVDGQVLSLTLTRNLQQALSAKKIGLRSDVDVLDAIWPERAGLPEAPIYAHEAPFATVSRAQKLARVRERMQASGADWHFISTVDDLAWLFNLRGSDVSYNPVFVGHALLGRDEATLFIADGKLSAELTAQLAAEGVSIARYELAPQRLAALPAGTSLLCDPNRVTGGLIGQLPAGVTVREELNPSTLMKACKTAEEAAHVRHAMEQDGAALCEFFAWLERAQAQGEHITQLTIDEQITAARARRPGFVCPSFSTIAGFNANGALPHYRATEEAHSVISGDGLLLIDSGGQYLGGTTDITRVVPVGEVSAAQKRDYTLVLKGMMALSRARFPKGIKSPLLDSIARAPLWAEGIDYGHGTGHGVGYFLNVHEGPQVISYYAQPAPQTAMAEGMITSIEPGIYRQGQWGVRIENLVINQSAAGEFGEYLQFETLTLCPIDTRCIDLSRMRPDEVEWLNGYHAEVRTRLLPLVEGEAKAWLERRTQPLA